jgi:hypothetical protein
LSGVASQKCLQVLSHLLFGLFVVQHDHNVLLQVRKSMSLLVSRGRRERKKKKGGKKK